MRILMISNHADPLAEIGAKESGGQNVYVFYLARHLARLGVEVDVYTRWNRRNKRETVQVNGRLRVIRVKAGPKKYVPRDFLLGVVDEFTDNVLKRIRREGLRYDAVHSNYWFSGLSGMALSRKLGIPQFHVFHSIGEVRFKALKHFKAQDRDHAFFRERNLRERDITRHATVVATSPVEKGLVRKFFGADVDRVRVIPVGVDNRIFRPFPSKTALRKSGFGREPGPHILYVGRIEWRKGIETLMKAFGLVLRRYPSARLHIVGGGRSRAAMLLDEAERERLASLADDLGLEGRVSFLGPKTQHELPFYYGAADVCVVPSYYEPFGIVPLEAMACGTPAVVSCTGGLKFTVRDGTTGYHAVPGSAEDFAAKIVLVLREGKSAFSQACLDRVSETFRWDRIAREYLKLFEASVAAEASRNPLTITANSL
jgi:D-inositol-3-phosphate glycosyltransferase